MGRVVQPQIGGELAHDAQAAATGLIRKEVRACGQFVKSAAFIMNAQFGQIASPFEFNLHGTGSMADDVAEQFAENEFNGKEAISRDGIVLEEFNERLPCARGIMDIL
ncbi:MAG: hypothetical protein NVSMB31_11030 [Vulcanimicrobiaceae bacterium]